MKSIKRRMVWWCFYWVILVEAACRVVSFGLLRPGYLSDRMRWYLKYTGGWKLENNEYS